MDIRPIKTDYNGVLYRSSLEAEWAAHFDSCGIEYEYEPKKFMFSQHEWYVPDFMLKMPLSDDLSEKDLYMPIWIEVKPTWLAWSKSSKYQKRGIWLFSKKLFSDKTIIFDRVILLCGSPKRDCLFFMDLSLAYHPYVSETIYTWLMIVLRKGCKYKYILPFVSEIKTKGFMLSINM